MVIIKEYVNKENACSHVLLLVMTTLDMRVEDFQKLEIGLPYDPAIVFLRTHPRDTVYSYRDPCLSMFTASLFVIARKWK